MAFSSNVLLCFLAIAQATSYVTAFGIIPSATQQIELSLNRKCFSRQITQSAVSLSPVDDIVADEEEEEEEDFIVAAGELGEDGESPAVEESKNFLHKVRLQDLREKYRRSENDSGSPEFQAAGMTERITYLTAHMKEHPKDVATRRGLVALVNKRRRILNYLARENPTGYVELVAALGIRHKAPSKVQTKEELYGRFPLQKKPKSQFGKK